MTVEYILEQLKALHNEKMYVHNKKYGAVEQYGVKLGDIKAFAKKIKTNHELALQLWSKEVVEAKMLATLIVDIKKISAEELTNMAAGINFSHVADWFSNYVVKSFPDKEALTDKWIASDNKWVIRLGWSLLAGKITRKADDLDINKILDTIEKDMPYAPTEVQWTMNTALAQIGINHSLYRNKAIEIGEKLGIYKDYPVSKGCTSPFAPVWINEMVKRLK